MINDPKKNYALAMFIAFVLGSLVSFGFTKYYTVAMWLDKAQEYSTQVNTIIQQTKDELAKQTELRLNAEREVKTAAKMADAAVEDAVNMSSKCITDDEIPNVLPGLTEIK